ncbi:YceI family protein [Streptomyces sp. NPDC059740]|uniref:YceI family protein n=1 Tax=Streptomyces sp. NPDC059740 TaxID=3346926 RepID=UPI00364672F7
MSVASTEIPGYTVGTWAIDPVHSEVSFSVKHLGIAKVKGRFDEFEGELTTAEDPEKSAVTATIRTASVSSGNADRDTHIRAEDFLHSEAFPAMTFTSTGVRAADGDLLVDGELTVRDVTRPVTLALEVNGFGTGMDGKPAAGFTATTEIRRSEFGVAPGVPAAALGDVIRITLEIEANQRA